MKPTNEPMTPEDLRLHFQAYEIAKLGFPNLAAALLNVMDVPLAPNDFRLGGHEFPRFDIS